MEIQLATLTCLYLFDVGEQIDLIKVREALGGGAARPLALKSPTPAYLQYQVPPLVIDGASAGVQAIEGFAARLKFFDYGVVSLSLS